MQQEAHEACAACIGLDWAESTPDVGLHAAGSATRASCLLTHTPEASDAGVSTLRTRCHGHPMAVCLERNPGPMVSALRTDAFLVLLPIHPLTLAR